jgi:hypothetical protein
MSPYRFVWLGGSLVIGLSGCGGSSQALERRMAELETQLTHAQNENDRLAERVGSLELERAAKGQQPVVTDEPAVLERPPLKVIRMDPKNGTDSTGQPGAGATPSAEKEAVPADNPQIESSSEPAPDPKRPVLRMRGNKGGFRQGSGQPPPS